MTKFVALYDQLQREAQLQDGCRKIVSARNSYDQIHICGKPRVTAEFCERHRFGV